MKNKYLKLLIVAILCFTLAFSAIWVTACKKDDNNGGGSDPVTYTVTFDSDGGSTVNSKSVNANEKVEKPDDPTKTGYDFVAWELNGVAYDFNTAVTGNITLKATWTVHYSTVKAMLDDKTVYDIQYVAYGETATKVAKDPAASGKIFDKWMLDEVAYNFDSPVTSDITLTASWNDKDYGSVEVTFESNGGSAVPTQTITTGGYATLPEEPTKTGFEFVGWYKDEALTEEFDIDNTAIKKATTIYAKWAFPEEVTAISESTTWEFNAGNYDAKHDEANNYFVATTDSVNYPDTSEIKTGSFHGLEIDITTGKLTSNGTSWYQFNTGTKLKFAVADTCTVQIEMYQSSTAYTVNGEEASSTHNYAFTGANYVEIESTANGYIGKITVTYAGSLTAIEEDKTITFGSNGNYKDISSDVLEIVSSTRDNGGDNTQFSTVGVALRFAVNKGAVIDISSFNGYTNYTIGLEGGDTSPEQTGTSYTFTAEKAGTIVICTTNSNNYLYSIKITYSAGADIPDGYELVDSTCPFSELAANYGDSTKISKTETYGNFSFESGLYFQKDKNCVNTQGKSITVTVSGIGTTNSISFRVENGASSNFTGVTVTNSAGTTIASCGNESYNFDLTDLPAGTYKIASNGGACRIYDLKTSEVLEQGVPVSMTVTPVTVDFLAGSTPTALGVVASVNYANGSIKTKTVLETDVTSVKTDRAGEYIIRVFYTESDETVTATYSVFVYELDSIALYTYTTNGTTQTTLQTVYVQNGTLSTAGMTVKAVGVLGEKTKEFIMTSNEYTLSTVDLSTLGEKVVTVTSKANGNIAASFNIYVVAKAEAAGNKVTVTVDPSQPVAGTNFQTITQAINYFTAANYGDSVVKVINVADGEYYEKISIRIANLQLVGSATATPDATTNNGVVIWYDAIAGMTDPTGAAYGTNGSATVSVIAANFVAKNITFKNYYNTNALYNESKSISGNTQAVALYVDSTSASFYNCKMTGYHDTLYANKGNQYYYQCWIEGRTDYIFGSDAHAYFYQCTINTVSAGSDDGNGGYVVAYQNTSASFGPIFNECNFTGAETGATGIALGRAWGANFHMVVINSSISANYSTAAHTAGTTKGQRYCTMSGNEPKPEYMIEANNTGAGSISASINNTCTVDPSATTTYGIDNLSSILGFTPAAD